MRFAVVLLVWIMCAACSEAATNVQAIQTLSTGTNNQPAALSVFTEGHRGVGTWTFTGGTNISGTQQPLHWKIGTNWPYRLPNVVTLNGTNYDQASDKWLYYTPTNSPSPADYFTFRPDSSGFGGSQKKLWMSFYLMLDHLLLPTANYDLITMNGQFGGYLIVQLENGSPIMLKAHGQGGGLTNGWQFHLQTNVVYYVTALYDSVTDAGEVRAYNATNNFAALTNLSDTPGAGLYVSTAQLAGGASDPTNAYNAVIQANYFHISDTRGRIWMSPPVFGWSNDALPPTPETNAIVSDRLASWVPGVNVGIRGARPNRTIETNASFYGVSTTSLTNHTALAYAWSVAASNTVILVDGASGYIPIYGSVLLLNQDGVTLRGTNDATFLLATNGRFSFGTTLLSASQAKLFSVTNSTGVRGATNLTLMTNYSPINAGFIAPNQMYYIAQRDGVNPRQRFFSNVGYDYTTEQAVLILSTNGNAVTIWPPLTMDFTNQPMLIQKAARAPLASALENITLTTTNTETHEWLGFDQIHLLAVNAVADSWISGCKFLYGQNYLVDMYYALNSEVNSNWFAGTAPTGDAGQGSGGGLQVVGANPYVYDNIFDNGSRCVQLFGGVNGAAFVGNFFRAEDLQIARAHNVGHSYVLWERNYSADSYLMLGDGYFGGNYYWVLYSNVFTQVSSKRFNWGHTIVGNTMEVNGEYGYPNLQNTNYIGISQYSGSWAESSHVSGPEWNAPSEDFFGTQGAGIYVNRWYSNCVYTFTNVSLEITDGTNYLGNWTNWPFASVNYALVFSNANTWYRLSDYTNNPVAVSYLRAVAGPTESNMLVSGYVPVQNGWTMYVIGTDTFPQLQTIDSPTLQVTANTTNGVPVNDTITLPMNYPLWMGPTETPSWWVGATWPNNNPAKNRFDAAADYTEVTNAPPRIRGIRF